MSRVVAATMTWARTAAEGELIVASLERLLAHGLPVVAAEGGSDAAFVNRLRTLEGLTLVEPLPGAPRLMGQVRASLRAAAALGPEYVLYTESDKGWFFEHRLGEFLARREDHPEAAILIPARDDASFATYPSGQQLPETILNCLAADLLETDGDTVYGPLLIRRDLVAPLVELEEDLGWGWRIHLLALTRGRGLLVVCSPMDLPCPPEQRGENELRDRLYRLEQLAQNIRGLTLGLKASVADVAQAV